MATRQVFNRNITVITPRSRGGNFFSAPKALKLRPRWTEKSILRCWVDFHLTRWTKKIVRVQFFPRCFAESAGIALTVLYNRVRLRGIALLHTKFLGEIFKHLPLWNSYSVFIEILCQWSLGSATSALCFY